jgi:adenylyl- and sulfurtransferase ThiI
MPLEPINDYSITPHAAFEMMRRGLTEEVVHQVLTAPEQRLNVRSGRVVLQSRIDFHDQTYLVRVFVDIEPRPAEVVTVYRTSKITKYWRATP